MAFKPSLRQRLRATRSALQTLAVDRAIHAFARVRYAMPDAHPRRHDVIVHRDLVYTDAAAAMPAAAHRLDVYVPRRAHVPLPVVMYVHGGAFSMLSKDTHRVMAMAFARRGYLVFNINYRLGPKHAYPAPLEDACSALLWVNENCARFGGDPARIALAGESAGGNLVTALAVAHATPRPEPFARRVYDANISIRAVIATYPLIDLTDLDRVLVSPRMSPWVKDMLRDAVTAYVGHDVHAVVRDNPLTSPLLLLEGAFRAGRAIPPFFTNAGTKDPLLSHARRLKVALDRLAVPCELHISPGEIHGFDAMVWRPAAREKWQKVYEFLHTHMAVHATVPTEGEVVA